MIHHPAAGPVEVMISSRSSRQSLRRGVVPSSRWLEPGWCTCVDPATQWCSSATTVTVRTRSCPTSYRRSIRGTRDSVLESDLSMVCGTRWFEIAACTVSGCGIGVTPCGVPRRGSRGTAGGAVRAKRGRKGQPASPHEPCCPSEGFSFLFAATFPAMQQARPGLTVDPKPRQITSGGTVRCEQRCPLLNRLLT